MHPFPAPPPPPPPRPISGPPAAPAAPPAAPAPAAPRAAGPCALLANSTWTVRAAFPLGAMRGAANRLDRIVHSLLDHGASVRYHPVNPEPGLLCPMREGLVCKFDASALDTAQGGRAPDADTYDLLQYLPTFVPTPPEFLRDECPSAGVGRRVVCVGGGSWARMGRGVERPTCARGEGEGGRGH